MLLCATPWTKTLWIYDFRTNEHFTLKADVTHVTDMTCSSAQHYRVSNTVSPPRRAVPTDWDAAPP